MEKSENSTERAAEAVMEAALAHVAFDGWSEKTFRAATCDSGVDPGLAAALYPRGGIDLAAAYHRRGDRLMAERLAQTDLAALRYRDRVALSIRYRMESADREAVRHGSTLFALPNHAAEGAGLIWGTADAIWRALGDTSRDANWYSKRATLSAVYGASVLYWLGDASDGAAETWAFVDRRIEDVIRFEKLKAGFRASALGKALAGPFKILERISAPQGREDLPGQTGV